MYSISMIQTLQTDVNCTSEMIIRRMRSTRITLPARSKMADGCFLVFCGIPASGKTSLAKELIFMNWEIIGKRVHFIYVSYDDFIPDERPTTDAETSSFTSLNWKEKRRAIVKGLEEMVLRAEDGKYLDRQHGKSFGKMKKFVCKSCPCDAGHMTRASDDFHVIIIDDNMYYRSMRYEYYQLARTASFGFAEIYLHCRLEVALSRNANRQEAVAEDTIIKMVDRLEKPDPQKFPWERFSLMLDSNTFETYDKWTKILKLLQSAANNVPPALEVLDENKKAKDRAITEKNIVHQADQVMRKHISSKLENIKANMRHEDLKREVQSLNQRKKKVLERIKTDPRQFTANIFLKQFEFSCALEKSRTAVEKDNANLATLVPTPAEFDSRLFLENIWDVVSVGEFDAVVRNLFEQCA